MEQKNVVYVKNINSNTFNCENIELSKRIIWIYEKIDRLYFTRYMDNLQLLIKMEFNDYTNLDNINKLSKT